MADWLFVASYWLSVTVSLVALIALVMLIILMIRLNRAVSKATHLPEALGQFVAHFVPAAANLGVLATAIEAIAKHLHLQATVVTSGKKEKKND